MNIIDNNSAQGLKGHFLLAMPGLIDQYFYRTVICISEYSEKGALGIILNKKHPIISGKDIFRELGINYTNELAFTSVYMGGPVHINKIFVLHEQPFNWNGTRLVTESLALTDTRDIIQEIAVGRGPSSFILSIGCAVWNPGQIEKELKQNVWLTGPLSRDIIFNTPAEAKWAESFKILGIEPEFFTGVSGNA